MLDENHALDRSLVDRYGHLLPDTLIRSAIDVAPAREVAQSDVAALAEAALRAPTPRQ